MLGDLISAGINFFTGMANRDAQADANAANIANQQAINAQNIALSRENNAAQLAFARENLASNREYAEKNIAQQRDFAQQGIRWKVSDAQAAGLHPLAALGSQVSSFSPIQVGSTSYDPKTPDLRSADVKAAQLDMGSMGQNIGRAIDAGSTANERQANLMGAVSRIATALDLEKASLDNELVRTQIAATRSQIGPPIPIPRPGPARSVSGHAITEDDIKQKPEDAPQTAIVRPFGYPLTANPYFSDGQQFEDRYGDSEIGSTIKFAVNMLADHVMTGYGLLPPISPGSGSRIKRFRKGNYTAPSYRPWAE